MQLYVKGIERNKLNHVLYLGVRLSQLVCARFFDLQSNAEECDRVFYGGAKCHWKPPKLPRDMNFLGFSRLLCENKVAEK